MLDEANLPRSRVRFLPSSVTDWLASYRDVILPYARAAQQAGASYFYTGAELSEFAHATQWREVTAAVRAVFKGRLYFSANWTSPAEAQAVPGSGGPGATAAADAYPDSHAPPGQFGPWWAAEAGELPRGTVLSEAGIAAQAGMQEHPWEQGSPRLAPGPAVASRLVRRGVRGREGRPSRRDLLLVHLRRRTARRPPDAGHGHAVQRLARRQCHPGVFYGREWHNVTAAPTAPLPRVAARSLAPGARLTVPPPRHPVPAAAGCPCPAGRPDRAPHALRGQRPL